MNDWTDDIELVLENIRLNCVLLSNEHKIQYINLKENLKYFRLPIIIISGINSIFSVGLQAFINQQVISIINCLLALGCSIIGSIELYLGIQKEMENALISQKEFYLISVDIFKVLSLNKEHRPIPSKEYLDKIFSDYTKLIEKSNTITKKLEDKLMPITANISKKEII
jgi:hypothetical protein